jgi:hypothetical protein
MIGWKGIVATTILSIVAVSARMVVADGPTSTVTTVAPDSSAQRPVPVKTGKERLSDKSSDEQRVDNCKVPPERQGAKVRDDSCERSGQAASSNLVD